jgi:hypothetical protein
LTLSVKLSIGHPNHTKNDLMTSIPEEGEGMEKEEKEKLVSSN